MIRRTVGLAVVVLLTGIGSGCGTANTVECPSWAGFPTVEDKYEAADLVVVASASTPDGTAPIFGVDASSWVLRVDDVLKGEITTGSVRVSSMPETCSGSALYPGGDPLDMAEETVVFADRQESEWFTITPVDGSLPYTPETVGGLR